MTQESALNPRFRKSINTFLTVSSVPSTVSDLRYSFYDSLTGSFRFMTYSGGYAFKYASFSWPTYNDTYWWD